MKQHRLRLSEVHIRFIIDLLKKEYEKAKEEFEYYLEVQISQVLKQEYPKLRSKRNEDETIRDACTLLNTDRESVIRSSVDLLSDESWLTEFCRKFGDRFKFPCL